jgi:predicted transposase YbfD/YdcC
LCIRREFTYLKSHKKTQEAVFGITSLSKEKAGPARLLELNRGHWGIENCLHYVRDVTFHEDHSQIRTKSAPRVMASIRNFAISLFHWLGNTNIAKTLREMAAKPHMSLRILRF